MEMETKEVNDVGLFETKAVKGQILFRLYSASIFTAISFVCAYRVSCFPSQGKLERWTWIGLFLAELWFSLYFFLTTILRWNPLHHLTFKDRLSHKFRGEELPGVDVFVCTADARIEPPTMVLNTVLSVMAYDYPVEKLSVYLSDDGGSELMFYAMLEASRFSKEWLPFCKRFKAEPRAPEAYFREAVEPQDDPLKAKDWFSMKKSYEDMKMRVETMTKLGRISEDTRKEHKGFREWAIFSSPSDHQTILQILIDGRDPEAKDVEGENLPTLVYLAREKRPQYQHHFKAGALNALLRVSSRISNCPVILTVDCDMYSNNSESIGDALCFFMDEENGQDIAYVQHPQRYHNLKKNDIYATSFIVAHKFEFADLNGNGVPPYIGTGCFHWREVLSGKKSSREHKIDWKLGGLNDRKNDESTSALEAACKVLASCTYEQNTQWGKEMGLKYGCPAEDIITGLSIQCRGWRSVYFNPLRPGFMGIAPTTLLQSLVQHKRWSEGHFQIFLSRYCPLLYGHKKIPLKLQLSYCPANLWAANCLPTLYYIVVPSLCLLRGISLFPKVSSLWIVPFAYATFASLAYSLGEFIWCGGTFHGWCNEQRMSLFRRTTSYFFGFSDTILKLLGVSEPTFAVTAKVADEDVTQRFEQEVMEFGAPSPMFSILATLALLNLFSFIGGIRRVVMMNVHIYEVSNIFCFQVLLSLVLVAINWPVYQAIFFRKDNGSMPPSVTYQSIFFALLACTIAIAM